MKTFIKLIQPEEMERAELYVHKKDESVRQLAWYIEQEQHRRILLTCLKEGDIVKLPCSEIDYIETVQEKQLVHTAGDTLEIKMRLYELERILPYSFIRISKSVILNSDHVKQYRPMVNGLMAAILPNSAIVFISRKYLKEVRSRILEVQNERKSTTL